MPSRLNATIVPWCPETFGGAPPNRGGRADGLGAVVDRDPVEEARTALAAVAPAPGWPGPALGRQPRVFGRDFLGVADRRPVAGVAEGVPQSLDLLAPTPAVGRRWHLAEGLAGLLGRAGWAAPPEVERGLLGWVLRPGQKRGSAVGKTKRGKGTKWMVVADGSGLPLGSALASASPAEVRLAEQTLQAIAVPRQGPGRPRQKPERVIADRGYDSDPLRRRLAARGIELIVPHRSNRVRPPTQDGRPLRRYQRRWKIERLFAWLGNYRRLIVRHERLLVTYRAFFHVACALIVLRSL